MRLLELGASADLNLLLDRFCYTGRRPDSSAWTWGPEASPVRFSDAIEGRSTRAPSR